MMLSNANNSDSRYSSNAQLLHDIEEISKALYVHKTPPKNLLPPAYVRSQSVGKTRSLETISNSIPNLPREDLLSKEKKLSSSSSWNWRKPLKALTHIGNRKFSCCFFLHVHSIEGLPVNFDGFSLSVYLKRKDEVLRTHPSRVFQGMVEFDQALMHRCSVYSSKSGPHNLAKYDAKIFLIYVSVIGVPELDIGKHWVDLTRLLPLTLGELEGEKSSGKWMTSFKLTGKAGGASLNVSFGYTVMTDDFTELTGNMVVSNPRDLRLNRSRIMENGADIHSDDYNANLYQGESLRSNLSLGSVLSLQSIDGKTCHELLFNPGLDFSKSINFLYTKLGEESLLSSTRSSSEDVKPDLECESSEDHNGYEDDGMEFTIVERGIELPKREDLQSHQATVQTIDGSAIETINFDEILKDDDTAIEEKTNCDYKVGACCAYLDEAIMDGSKYEENSLSTRESTMEEANLASHHHWISESVESDCPWAVDEFIEHVNLREVQSHYQQKKTVKKSIGLDDVTEAVARDFLNLLGMEHGSSRWTSDSDLESPREHLLREFEMDALASGNCNIYFDAIEEQSEFSCSDPPRSSCGEYLEDSDLSSIIQAAEQQHNREAQLLRNRRNVKILEDLETEALMREWGLNEEDLEISPHNHSGGFGSPIELAPEEPLELPPLGVGLGPFVWTKSGAFLRSMNASLFRNAKNGGSLIMQASCPVVLPASMGYDIMEISQHLALVGAEKVAFQANKLMPLVDISGKMMEELAMKAASSWSSCLIDGLDYMSLKDLVPFAMDKVETLLIEGLRIQSGVSDEDAPSSIDPHSSGIVLPLRGKTASSGWFHRSEGSAVLEEIDVTDSVNDIDRLLDLSLPLDDWLRLDAGIIDEGENTERILELLAAHHANCTDIVSGMLGGEQNWNRVSGLKHGLLGNKLIVALMLQLRDPLRNHESVGIPMLALLEAERAFVPTAQRSESMITERSNNEGEPKLVLGEISDMDAVEKNEVIEEDSIPKFKISEVHLAGVNSGPGKRQYWGSATQRQSGSRWLLVNGMAKTNKQPLSKSRALVVSSPLMTTARQPGDFLWSISSHVHCMGGNCVSSHVRNPDVIFPNETVRSPAAYNF